MRNVLFLAAALAVSVAIGAGALLLGGPTESSASHEAPSADGVCSIPGGGTAVGNAASNEPCVADFVALDADVSGNTDSAIGAIEECVSVATGASFSVDLIVDAIPDVADATQDGIASWQAVVQYDSANLTLTNTNRAQGTGLLGNDPDSSLLNPPPTELQVGPPRIVAFGSQDIAGGAAAEEAIAGTLARLTFTAGGSPAIATVVLMESFGVNDSKLITVDNDTYGIGNFTGGESAGQFLTATIAIGQGCPLPPDPGGPTTSNVQASPSPTNGAATLTVSASISDVASGNRNIAAAEVFFDSVGADGSGTAMAATDGSFDEPVENVSLNVPTASLTLGEHTVHVHGQDAEGNWGTTASTVVTVTDVPVGAETASISIIGGALFIQTSPVDFGTVELTGDEQTVDTQPSPWGAGDATGTGAGWNVSMTSTDFVAGGNSIDVSNFMIMIDQANVVTQSGNTAPQSQVASFQALSDTTPLKILSAAAGTGMGSYQFTPDFRLVVPGDAGTGDYQALMTVTVNAGP
jgi:hypothetical protein